MPTINLNDTVRVRLTERGRRLLHEQRNALFAGASEQIKARLIPLEEDSDGRSEWTLWELMHEFGRHMYNGADLVVETTIELEAITQERDRPVIHTALLALNDLDLGANIDAALSAGKVRQGVPCKPAEFKVRMEALIAGLSLSDIVAERTVYFGSARELAVLGARVRHMLSGA